jgi:hypothetical protein
LWGIECRPSCAGDLIGRSSIQTNAASRRTFHLRSDDFEAKFWLHDLSVAVNAGFPAQEIGSIIRHLRSQRDLLEGKWHEYFGN